MNQITVTLGGREFEIQPLHLGPARAWRAKFKEQIAPLAQMLSSWQSISLNDAQSMGELARVVSDSLLGAPDMMFDMLCAYAPVIRDNSEWIEANAYDKEVAAAFMEVLKLAFPLGELAALVQGGRQVSTTSKNSPSPNTAGKSATARTK